MKSVIIILFALIGVISGQQEEITSSGDVTNGGGGILRAETTEADPGAVIKPYASAVINILVIIETESLFNDHHGKRPSHDFKRPTSIGHQYAFMVAPKQYVKNGQATADLHIKNVVGDTIRWFGVSESNNFDNSIIVYNITHNSAALNRPEILPYDNVSCVNPVAGDINHTFDSKCNYISVTAGAKSPGQVDYHVYFALYTRSRTNGKQELFGYFEWDPKITIIG